MKILNDGKRCLKHEKHCQTIKNQILQFTDYVTFQNPVDATARARVSLPDSHVQPQPRASQQPQTAQCASARALIVKGFHSFLEGHVKNKNISKPYIEVRTLGDAVNRTARFS